MQSHLIIAVLVIGLSGCAGLNVHYNEPVSANTGPGVSVFFDAFGDIYPEDVTKAEDGLHRQRLRSDNWDMEQLRAAIKVSDLLVRQLQFQESAMLIILLHGMKNDFAEASENYRLLRDSVDGHHSQPNPVYLLVFANHPSSEFHSSDPGWMNDSRFNGTAGSQ